MREIDKILESTPLENKKTDKEVLVTLTECFCKFAHKPESSILVHAFLVVLRAMKAYGLDFHSLSDNYNRSFADPAVDAYNTVRLLASRHPLSTKLIVAAGTLLAQADSHNVDLLGIARKKIESFA